MCKALVDCKGGGAHQPGTTHERQEVCMDDRRLCDRPGLGTLLLCDARQPLEPHHEIVHHQPYLHHSCPLCFCTAYRVVKAYQKIKFVVGGYKYQECYVKGAGGIWLLRKKCKRHHSQREGIGRKKMMNLAGSKFQLRSSQGSHSKCMLAHIDPQLSNTNGFNCLGMPDHHNCHAGAVHVSSNENA